MITERRSADRHRTNDGAHCSEVSRAPESAQHPSGGSIDSVVRLDEIKLGPGEVFSRQFLPGVEVVTYVQKGTLSQRDRAGRSNKIRAGEFQRMSVDRATRYQEANAGKTETTHVFRISLRSTPPTAGGHAATREQKRFVSALRRNALCVIASHDGRAGSLPIVGDALIFSSSLDPGRHLVHELRPDRCAWVHVILGAVKLRDLILSEGDGARVAGEPSVSLTAEERSEILLIDTRQA